MTMNGESHSPHVIHDYVIQPKVPRYFQNISHWTMRLLNFVLYSLDENSCIWSYLSSIDELNAGRFAAS